MLLYIYNCCNTYNCCTYLWKTFFHEPNGYENDSHFQLYELNRKPETLVRFFIL